MYISPIDNTNFQSLHVSNKTLKAIGCTRKELLRNRSIREASEKYDVLVKAGNGERYKDDPWWPLNTIARTMATSLGAGTITAVTTMLSTDVAALGLLKFMGICAIPTFTALWLNQLYDKHKYKPVKEIVIQAGKGVDENEDYINNCSTPEHIIQHAKSDLPLTREVKEAENTAFKNKIKTYDTDDLFTAKNYLAALKKADIEVLGGGEYFNRPIDEKGNTMITSFFDVLPTHENQKEYSEILNIIKNTKGINYNLKDGGGISCLEKIINSENKQVLPLIKNFKFDYYPELELVYNNIQDKTFKQEFDKLHLRYNFKDILEAVKLKSYHILTRLRPQLLSPFCDRYRLAEQIEQILQEQGRRTESEYIHMYYSEYVNPDRHFKLDEWNIIVDEYGKPESDWIKKVREMNNHGVL